MNTPPLPATDTLPAGQKQGLFPTSGFGRWLLIGLIALPLLATAILLVLIATQSSPVDPTNRPTVRPTPLLSPAATPFSEEPIED